MTSLPGSLAELYPFSPRRLALPAGEMSYLDEGPADAPVLVCVHGNPTWSFYWRRLAQALAGRMRVIVPDHIGCGLSDKPTSGFDYRLASHTDNLRRLLDHLEVERASFAVHDWGGAIGFGLCAREPERAERLLVTNTAAFPSPRIPTSIASGRIPGFGALAIRGLNLFARVATWRATAKGLSEEVKAGLLFPYDSWDHRIAVHRFVQDIPMSPAHPSWSTLEETARRLDALVEHEMLILWGDDDFCFDVSFRKEWQARFPKAECHAWADVGHYVMEDAPERVLERAVPFFLGERDATARSA